MNNILSYVMDDGKKIELTEAERNMLISLCGMLLEAIDHIRSNPSIANMYTQSIYATIEQLKNDGKKVAEEKESTEANKETNN